MALIVWMPLNGNINNYGLSDVKMINNSTTFDNESKIGKSCYLNGSSYLNENTYDWSNFNVNQFSICCWYKEPSVASGNSQMVVIGTSSGWNNIRIGLLRRTSTGYPLFSVSDGTNNINYSFTASTFTLNEWVHIAVTYDSGKMSMYINGQLDKTSQTSIVPVIDSSQHLGIGAASNGAEKLLGYLNDVRIYDNVLSAKEIHEISKGLMLHYKLDNNSFGAENLFKYVPNTVANGSYLAYRLNLSENLQAGQTYTMQLWDVDVSHSAKTEAQTNVAVYWGGGSIQLFKWNGGVDFTNGHADYLTKTFTPTESQASHSNATNAYFNIYNSVGNADGVRNLSIGKWKLEKGDIPTTWSLSKTDPIYSSFGFDSTEVVDVSGYSYHGISNNITYDSNSPRYNTCSVFNGSDSYIKCDTNAWMIQGATEFTLNLWAYSNDWTTQTNGRLFSCTESGGFNIEAGASGYLRFSHYVYTNAEKTTKAYQFNNSGIKLADLTQGWHMFTIIYTGAGEQIYIDGKSYSSANNTSYGISFNTNARLFLGCEANSYLASAPYFNGKMSDFRIYSTALSAEDILSLYNAPMTLANNGTLLTQGEFSEV